MAGSRQERINETIPNVSWDVARYVTTNTDGTVQVDFGQGQITVLNAGLYAPRPGESVRVLKVNATTVMIGPSAPKSSQGTVVATGSPNLTIDTSVGQMELPYLEAYSSPTVGDEVLIDWSLGAVLGKLTTVPAEDAYEPPPPATGGNHRIEVNAQWAGTYYVPGGRWNSDEVYAVGTGNNIGAWGYGTAVADSIPDGATINDIWIYTPELWNQFPGTETQLGTHALVDRSGAPSLGSLVGIPAGSGWKKLPNSIGDALKTGTAYGLGTGLSGHARYKSLAQDSWSGRLRIDYYG